MTQTPIPILNLGTGVKWEVSKQKQATVTSVKLGDGYSINTVPPNSDRITYSITIPGLNTASKNNIANTLKAYQGVTKFRWQPIPVIPYKTFICDRFSVIHKGDNVWEITANFIEQK